MQCETSPVSLVEFTSYEESVALALDEIGAADILAGQKKVLLKPNLVNASPPPITTPPEFCEAVIAYVRSCSDAQIEVAEGSGDATRSTAEIFEILGYADLAENYNVKLVDLNEAPLTRLTIPDRPVFPEMYLPKIAFTHFIVSLPVLKAHSLAGVTGALKNMMGFAPPKYYMGSGGSWKKSVFHLRMQQSIKDLNAYIKPHLAVMDATVGMPEYHLGGRHCDPPVNKILASLDPCGMDRRAAGLLGLNWKDIGHLRD